MHNLSDQQILYTYCQSTIFSIKSSKLNLIPLKQLTITHWHKHKTHKHFIGKSQFFMKVQFTNPVLSFDRSTFQQVHEEEEFYGSLRNRKAWESASFDEVKHTDFVTNANERAKRSTFNIFWLFQFTLQSTSILIRRCQTNIQNAIHWVTVLLRSSLCEFNSEDNEDSVSHRLTSKLSLDSNFFNMDNNNTTSIHNTSGNQQFSSVQSFIGNETNTFTTPNPPSPMSNGLLRQRKQDSQYQFH